MDDHSLRAALCAAAQQLWQRGLIAGDGGLLSVQLHRRRFLVTPGGKRRADMRPEDLVGVGLSGSDLTEGRGVASEMWLPHRIAYEVGEAGDDPRGRRDAAEASPPSTSRGRFIPPPSVTAATVLATPPHVLAVLQLARSRPDAPRALVKPQRLIFAGQGLRLPLSRPDDEATLRRAFTRSAVVLLDPMGLLAIGRTPGDALNAIEQFELAATLELAALPHAGRAATRAGG